MASRFSKLSKWLLISGGAMMALSLIIGLAVATTGPGSVSAQASPTARPATPAAPAAPAATPVRTPTPAAPAATATRPPATATAVRAPSATPATGDSMTFPALAIALAGAGLVGLGLFARYATGKSKA
jgi:Mrp family chromosome partitioning ATPase